jgi:hypothetical protein
LHWPAGVQLDDALRLLSGEDRGHAQG